MDFEDDDEFLSIIEKLDDQTNATAIDEPRIEHIQRLEDDDKALCILEKLDDHKNATANDEPRIEHIQSLEDDDETFLGILEEWNDQPNATEIDEPRIEHIQCLENSFGHSDFRPSQWKVIRSIIEDKRDNCAIMATGYGKSLCFQFPPVFSNGISFIVSPLISLMQDQVDSLNMVNIPACLLGSAQSNKCIEKEIIQGDYRIVYASPEFITGSGSYLIEKLKDKLTLIAVDEAHCVSKWGCDFRPKFLELKNIRVNAPNVPILAVTATASERVQRDICDCLKLRNPQIICTGFDRPNLEIVVQQRTREACKNIEMILRSKLLATASCIVYCLTRKTTDKICDELQRSGLKCGAYHAGKTQKQRKDVYDKFVRDEINIVVATVAFGMGIDKSDVRCVIHYGAPADIDSYYQEIGRAGRDGVQSKCILFYSENDFQIHRQLRLKSNLTGAALRNAEVRLDLMREFIHTTHCRRLKILQYFDGPSAKCPKLDVCCDNCRIAKNPGDAQNNVEVDFSKDAKIMLEAISLFNGKTGLSKPIAVIRGSKKKAIERYHDHRLIGSGKFKSEEYWKMFADLLEQQGFLERKNVQSISNYSFMNIELSSKGWKWLNNSNNAPLKLVPSDRLFQLMTSGNSTSSATISSAIKPLYNTSINPPSHGTLPVAQSSKEPHQELKRNLMTVRAMIASREGTMPYKIALEPAIDRLVCLQPLNLQELRNAKVEGFSEAIIKQFGMEFLQCIQRWKGLIPQEIAASQTGQQQDSNACKENRASDDTNSNISNISNAFADTIRHNDNAPLISNVKDATTSFQDAFNDDDDDDLFMMVDYENAEESSNKTTNQPSIHQPFTNEPSTNHASTNQASTNQASTNQASTNQASSNHASTNHASTNQASTNQASTNQASTNQASINQASINQASINQASINQASINQASINQASTNPASINQASTNQASTNQPEKNDGGTKRLIKITKTVSKRINYDDGSSDDDEPPTHKKKDNDTNRPQLHGSPKNIGIRKRNIF